MGVTCLLIQPGDYAVCFKLKGRAPEGVILSEEEIQSIGYELVLIRAEDPKYYFNFVDKLETVAELLSYKDDKSDLKEEQPPGTRRKGNAPMQHHFVMRLPIEYGGDYRSVSQFWGTEEWVIANITKEQAEKEYAKLV